MLRVAIGSVLLVGCTALPRKPYADQDWPAELRSPAQECADRINGAATAYEETARWEFWTGLGLGGAGASLGAIGVAADDSQIGSWTAVGLGLLAAGRQIALSQGWLDTEQARGRYDRAVGRFADAEDHRSDASQLKRSNQVVHLDMKQTVWRIDITDRGHCTDPVLLKGQWPAGGTTHDCKAGVEVTLTTAQAADGERRFLEGSNPAVADLGGPDGRCSVQIACLGPEDHEAWLLHVESVRSSLLDCVRDPHVDPDEEAGEVEPEAGEAVEEAPGEAPEPEGREPEAPASEAPASEAPPAVPPTAAPESAGG